MAVLREYKRSVNSRWMFPSPKKGDSPLDPASCRKKLRTTLEHAQCKQVRFHDLRHTFATTATTLNVYTHTTEAMRRSAAAKIDRGIGKSEA